MEQFHFLQTEFVRLTEAQTRLLKECFHYYNKNPSFEDGPRIGAGRLMRGRHLEVPVSILDDAS